MSGKFDLKVTIPHSPHLPLLTDGAEVVQETKENQKAEQKIEKEHKK